MIADLSQTSRDRGHIGVSHARRPAVTISQMNMANKAARSKDGIFDGVLLDIHVKEIRKDLCSAQATRHKKCGRVTEAIEDVGFVAIQGLKEDTGAVPMATGKLNGAGESFSEPIQRTLPVRGRAPKLEPNANIRATYSRASVRTFGSGCEYRSKLSNFRGGQRRDRTADAGLFRAPYQWT